MLLALPTTIRSYKSKKATIIEDNSGQPAVNITLDNTPGASVQVPMVYCRKHLMLNCR